MKAFIYTVLTCLLACCFVLMFYLMIDISVAQRDYQRLANSGDYEQTIKGCIFDYVCNYYNEKLWR